MANHTSRLGQRPFKSLIVECNKWLMPYGLRVVDWAMSDPDIPPNRRFFLETLDSDDWDSIPCLRIFYGEMRQKYEPKPQNT